MDPMVNGMGTLADGRVCFFFFKSLKCKNADLFSRFSDKTICFFFVSGDVIPFITAIRSYLSNLT